MRKRMFMLAWLSVAVIGCGGTDDTEETVDTDRPTEEEIDELVAPEIEVGTESGPGSFKPAGPVDADPAATVSEKDEPVEVDPIEVDPIDPDPGVMDPVEKDIFGDPAENAPAKDEPGGDETSGAGPTDGLGIAELVARLGDAASLDAASAELRRRGAEAVPELIAALASEDAGTRAGAAFTLSLFGPDAAGALTALEKVADNEQEAENVRVAARNAADAVQGR